MAVYIQNTGGYMTKDADAAPEDVIEGRIFYNADGRQVGTAKKGITIPGQKSYYAGNLHDPSSAYEYECAIYARNVENTGYVMDNASYLSKVNGGSGSFSDTINCVNWVDIEGEIVLVGIPVNRTHVQYGRRTGVHVYKPSDPSKYVTLVYNNSNMRYANNVPFTVYYS